MLKKMNLLLMCLLAGLLLFACTPTPIPISTPEPVTFRVAPDGSGDYPSLEAAVDAIPPESTIILSPGTHRLEKPLDIHKPLRLIGAGMDQTEIVSEAKGYVVRFSGDGPFAAEDIAFRHQGTAVSDVVVVEGGEIAFARCRFIGAVWVEGEEYRAGLRLRGNTTGVVRECEAVENSVDGIMVEDRAQPTLEGNICTGNEWSGISYFDNSAGVARQNECSKNRFHDLYEVYRSHGIFVTHQAQPTLEGNVCTDNNGIGIAYNGNAGGVARQNECSGSEVGILVNEQARPTLEENACTDNEFAGIFYAGNASGVARQNECSRSSTGIHVTHQARPMLEENVCADNEKDGIAYSNSAGGVARQNKCSGNEWDDILVLDQAQPTLEGNVCTDNGADGIAYKGNAGEVARQNECSGNQVGISVAETSNPDLVDNKCHNNTVEDVQDKRP